RGVPAAFFCVGSKVRAHPDVVARAYREGHLIGNHSDRHSLFTNCYGRKRLRRELDACQAAIASITGETPRFYRPPFGLTSYCVHRVAEDLGMQVVGWRRRGLDTLLAHAGGVVRRVLHKAAAGDIILLHDGGQSPERLVEITARILDGLQDKGLKLARLD